LIEFRSLYEPTAIVFGAMAAADGLSKCSSARRVRAFVADFVGDAKIDAIAWL
jgi:hypothetical protein